MKKAVLILVLLVIVTTGAFAQWFSFGGGALFDASFYNGVNYRDSGRRYHLGEQVLAPGAFIFIDARFVQAELSLTHGWHTLITNHTQTGGIEAESMGSALAVGFSVLGKVPFDFDGGVTLFPLLGANYNHVFQGTHGDMTAEGVSDHSFFGILAGVGADFDLRGNFFVRTEAMFHFRFPSRLWRDVGDAMNTMGSAANTFGMGPRIKLGFGYRFGPES